MALAVFFRGFGGGVAFSGASFYWLLRERDDRLEKQATHGHTEGETIKFTDSSEKTHD